MVAHRDMVVNEVMVTHGDMVAHGALEMWWLMYSR